MGILADTLGPAGRVSRMLGQLEPLFALGTRLWVSWQFFKSGLLKIQSWDSTLFLFEEEYRVPLLSPVAAAELVFPALLALGLLGPLGAIGLSAVNLLAVVAYAHVLLAEGFEAAVAQHYLWGFMLAYLVVHGNGPLALDRLLPK
ncbi:MAG: DoxX family membrane protein [Gammaproteobacteria bacterium]|nr:DoxX family membrane protein [Gammaproteobacteria bacterium]